MVPFVKGLVTMPRDVFAVACCHIVEYFTLAILKSHWLQGVVCIIIWVRGSLYNPRFRRVVCIITVEIRLDESN
jgi:hypothetical protein